MRGNMIRIASLVLALAPGIISSALAQDWTLLHLRDPVFSLRIQSITFADNKVLAFNRTVCWDGSCVAVPPEGRIGDIVVRQEPDAPVGARARRDGEGLHMDISYLTCWTPNTPKVQCMLTFDYGQVTVTQADLANNSFKLVPTACHFNTTFKGNDTSVIFPVDCPKVVKPAKQ